MTKFLEARQDFSEDRSRRRSSSLCVLMSDLTNLERHNENPEAIPAVTLHAAGVHVCCYICGVDAVVSRKRSFLYRDSINQPGAVRFLQRYRLRFRNLVLRFNRKRGLLQVNRFSFSVNVKRSNFPDKSFAK